MRNIYSKYLNFMAVILLAACAPISCNENRVHRKVDDNFPENRWAKNDVRTYDFKITSDAAYDLSILFSHVYETPLEHIPITVILSAPSMEPQTFNLIMHLRDGSGNQVSDCAGDYCDFMQEVFKNRNLPAGDYKVSIANTFDYDFLPNVLGLGIQVDKSGK